MDEAALEAEVSAFAVAQGLGNGTLAGLVGGFAERLEAGGVPLTRAYAGLPTISPDTRASSVSWRRGRGLAFDEVLHDRHAAVFEASPLHFLLTTGTPKKRWRLAEPGGCEGYPVLEEFRARGDTDYLAHLVGFGEDAPPTALRGVALTVCTDRPAGFHDAEIRLLERLAPTMALAAYRIALMTVARDVLGAYLGRDPADRVLAGAMRRGEGHRRLGALLVADLRGFTGAAETGGEGLVARLGEHFAAMVEPVEAAGGEVLKFMGDGVLAAFPADGDDAPASACPRALGAAAKALGRNAAVNDARPGEPRLDLDVALHLGEVFYGNVGAGGRLDFTVIGPAVNEAARIEALCKELGRPLLMSAPFAAACGRPVRSLGTHRLRGVSEPREIFAPA